MKTFEIWILISTALSPSVEAFWVPTHHDQVRLPAVRIHRRSVTVRRQALIYGWDDGDDSDDDDGTSTTTLSPYIDISVSRGSELDQCLVEGIEVAETISYDPDRLGSLARLAVAFSPPERSLQLDQIERVDVICVSQHHIDIQAVICENGGCLTLAVPIKFPKACDVDSHLEGCVISHLEVFDETATSMIERQEETDISNGSLDSGSSSATEYPFWWENPSSYEMVRECQSMCSILNDDEFQPEILALVQDALRKDDHGLNPISAKVLGIGPAGFYFKVRAKAPMDFLNTKSRILDLFSPFGGSSKTTVDALRAAVLGTVATAGQPGP